MKLGKDEEEETFWTCMIYITLAFWTYWTYNIKILFYIVYINGCLYLLHTYLHHLFLVSSHHVHVHVHPCQWVLSFCAHFILEDGRKGKRASERTSI